MVALLGEVAAQLVDLGLQPLQQRVEPRLHVRDELIHLRLHVTHGGFRLRPDVGNGRIDLRVELLERAPDLRPHLVYRCFHPGLQIGECVAPRARLLGFCVRIAQVTLLVRVVASWPAPCAPYETRAAPFQRSRAASGMPGR